MNCDKDVNNETEPRDANERLHDILYDLKSARSRRYSKNFENAMKSCVMDTCAVCKEKFMQGVGNKRVHRNRNQCWKFSKRNKMDPGELVVALRDLTFIEQKLIARVHPMLTVCRLKGCQFGYRGNVINFCQDVKEFASQLPHRLDSLTSVITVKYTGSQGSYIDFQVRSHKIREALLWLKENNEYYREIDICDENLNALPEDGNVFDELCSFELGESSEEESNLPEPFDGDGIEDIKSSGVPLTLFSNQNDKIGAALDWPEIGKEPVNEFIPGLIMCAFPALFPYGDCDLREPREHEIKVHEYFKHFLTYGDERFAQHKTFRFFAFNMYMRHAALTDGNVFLKKDHEISKMNVAQLKAHINANPNVLKQIMFMGSNLRGSKPFWKSRSGELRDMVEQIGLPTIFLTMSAADLYWPDLFRLLTSKDFGKIDMRERRKLLQENPLIVDMFFQLRLETFIENVLEPKYGIIDYWYRIEYQHRGSPHVHGLFWLKNAPNVCNYKNCSEDEKKNIVKYFSDLVVAIDPKPDSGEVKTHPCEILFENVVDVENDIGQLLKVVQRHECSRAYCKRVDKRTKQTVCRFHFPKDIVEAADIILNKDSSEFEFVPARNDEKLNKFNPFILGTWRANIDIAPVLSERAVIDYLCKYVSKSEVGSATLKEITSNICNKLSPDDKGKKAVQKILIKNCVERDISAQEVCHILMGEKLYSSGGRKFVVVSTKSEKWVPLVVNEMDRSVNNSCSSGKSFVEKYRDRPGPLHHLCLWDVAKYFTDSNWKRVSKPNIVRVFPRLKLTGCEESDQDYYKQKVLLFVPWTGNTVLKQEHESWKDVYDRCDCANFKTCEVDMNVVTSCDNVYEEENDDLLPTFNEDWMIASRLSAHGHVDQVELGRREIDMDHDWNAYADKYKSFGSLDYFKSFIANEKKKEIESTVCKELPDVTFSAGQLSVKNLMEQQIDVILGQSCENVPKRVLVQGKAGTGKSLLIQFLTETLKEKFGSGSFLLLGPTGVAAVNIGSCTIHSALKIPRCSSQFKELYGEAARKLHDSLENVKFIIVDEFSMVGCNLLGMMDKRMREGTGVNEPFGSRYVYFFGDYKQLPPLRDASLIGNVSYNELGHHGRNVFNSFDVKYLLNICHRQKDPEFGALLDRLSIGESTIQDYNLLKTRFITNVSFEEQRRFDKAVRLFSTVEGVKSFNHRKMQALFDEKGNPVPVARIPAKHHGKGASDGNVDQAGGLQNVLNLSRGCRIMLRTNLWVSKGLVNGAMGTVVDLIYEEGKSSPDHAPAILFCQFDDYHGAGVGLANLVPITSVVRSWTSAAGNVCSRQQFPTVLCYGCSIHKSQGLTLEKVVIDIGPKEFALGLCYVAMSRVKTFDGLLFEPFTYERFQQIGKRPEMLLRREFGKEFV